MTKAEALICNDSGLMHLASVAGLPTVAVFGPTTIALGYRPWQNQARVVERELFCRPCGKHGHVRCPLNTHECMKSISESQVLKEFRKVYKVPDQKGPY
jgi:heptosyltransferase-2